MTQNYRSGQVILDASYSLIQNNNPHRLETKLNIDKKLLSASDIIDANIEHTHYIDAVSEAKGIVNKIAKLHE